MFFKHIRLTPIAMVCAIMCHSTARAQDAVLPEVAVSADSDKRPSAQANRLGTSVQDTAQAVTLIDAALMQAQGATRLEDVVVNAPGVAQSQAHIGVFSNFILRGFRADNSTAYFKDGLRFNRQLQVSLQNIAQIEVVRGPSSLQYGQLAPGGLINFVTKKPTASTLRQVALGASNVGQLDAGMDIAGKLNDSGSALYRLNAEAKKLDSFRDQVEGNSFFFAPALTFKVADATTLDLSFEHTRLDTMYDSGLVAPDGRSIASARRIDPGTFYGVSDGRYDARSSNAAVRLEHALDNTWLVRFDHASAFRNINTLRELQQFESD